MTVLGQEVIDRLLKFRSTNAFVLSLYLAVEPRPDGLQDALSHLHSIIKPARALAESQDLEHYARDSLRADVQQVLSIGDRLSEFSGRTVTIFACDRSRLYEEASLPGSLADLALTSETPYLRPLLAAIDEMHRFGIVVVDIEHAWFYEMFLGEIQQIGERLDNIAQRIGVRRTQDRVSELEKDRYKQIAVNVSKLMDQTSADFLIVGGHEETVDAFIPHLPKALHEQIAGTFVIDTHALTTAQVREHAEPVEQQHEFTEDCRLVEEALERVATGGFGAIGFDWCLYATNEKGVETLLLENDIVEPGRVCDNCGWLGLDGEECPVCGSRTREAPDIIDEMEVAVVNASGRVRHIRGDTGLSSDHIAALLRFPVPNPLSLTA